MPELWKTGEGETGKSSEITKVAATVAVFAIAVSLFFLFEPFANKKEPASPGTTNFRMGEAELEYAKSLRFENIGLSRAENFLHQEVTTLNGEVVNDGKQAVQGLFVTTEFSDDLNQVVLRETRGVLGSPATVLAPGERRGFEISFEHVPSSWNRQQPSLRVASLELSAKK